MQNGFGPFWAEPEPLHFVYLVVWRQWNIKILASVDARETVGRAAVEPEGELVEIVLQMLATNRAGIRADESALPVVELSVAAVEGIAYALLGVALRVWLVGLFAKAPCVVASEPVGCDVVSVANSLSANAFKVASSLLLTWVRCSLSFVSGATSTNCFCGPPLPPMRVSSACPKRPSGKLSERTIAALSLAVRSTSSCRNRSP